MSLSDKFEKEVVKRKFNVKQTLDLLEANELILEKSVMIVDVKENILVDCHYSFLNKNGKYSNNKIRNVIISDFIIYLKIEV